MNYNKNKKYFRPTPSAKGVIIGVIVAIILFNISALWGVLAALAVAALVYFLYFGKPSDVEIDAQASAMLSDIKKRAFPKLGIEEEEVALANPIEFWGYEFGDALKDDANREAWNIQGKDGIWRSCEVFVGGFYFSEDVVHYYWRIASLVSDAVKEGTEEYFYKDIVSVKTESEDKEFKDPKKHRVVAGKRVRYETFILRNSGGESTVCSVNNSAEAEAAVNAFRALLKQKKLQQ